MNGTQRTFAQGYDAFYKTCAIFFFNLICRIQRPLLKFALNWSAVRKLRMRTTTTALSFSANFGRGRRNLVSIWVISATKFCRNIFHINTHWNSRSHIIIGSSFVCLLAICAATSRHEISHYFIDTNAVCRRIFRCRLKAFILSFSFLPYEVYSSNFSICSVLMKRQEWNCTDRWQRNAQKEKAQLKKKLNWL